ncbi:MAG: GNAT family N-acetyltransferase [Pseudomonadota bacterium]
MPTAAQNLVAFAVGRAVLNEAELLTLAVDPRLQRRGLGRACLNEFEMRAAAEGAEVLHLEVAETNHAARALYTSVGWHDVGRRRSYYTSPTGRIDAILMTKQLAAD